MQEVKPSITIAVGGMGVGKTFLTTKQIKEYAKYFAKKGRGVLIFDVNNEYTEFKTVHFDIDDILNAEKEAKKTGNRRVTQSEKNISNLKTGIRRVLPFSVKGRKMELAEKKITMLKVCNNFYNGLVLLDDINVYMTNFQAEAVQSLFKNIRHNGLDLILHMQSMNPLTRIHYESTTFIRMHYDRFDITIMKDKAGSYYEILKIAQQIVWKEYREYKNKRFHLYVNLEEFKIIGINESQFEESAKSFIMVNRSEPEFKRLCMEVARKNGREKPSFQDNIIGEDQWIESRKKMYLD